MTMPKVRQLALSDVLSISPTDSPTWPLAFAYIETNHVPFAPSHWADFRASIRAGINTPVVILAPRTAPPSLISGHHRVWAAVLEGLTHVPAIVTASRETACRLLDDQARNETNWKAA